MADPSRPEPVVSAPGPGPSSGDLSPGALERLLAVEPDERSIRRLVPALAEVVPEADAAALLLADGDRFAIETSIGLDEGTPAIVEEPCAAFGGDVPAEGVRVLAAPGPPFPPGTRCGAVTPVRAGETSGLLVLGTRAAEAFTPAALALLRLAADRAALALEAGRLARARAAAEEEARRTAEEMVSRRKTMDFILGVVGHDLRNPLGAIHMSAALLQKRGGLEGWQARAIDRTRSSAGRMGRIIADLLSYTRTRLGNGIPINRRPARLEEIARRVVDELSAANPDRAITIQAAGDVAGEWDADRLEQVVSNLVSNAVDHGDPASPVEVEVEVEGDPAGAAVLRVRNRGPPIPDEVLAHLFEPFSRPPDEKSRKGSGLGLGLYIAREIVRGHGGDIGVGSETDTVVMTVRLPRSAPAA